MARKPGYKHTEQTKRKIGDARRATLADPATRERIAAAQRGKVLTDETKARMSASQKAKWAARRAAKAGA